jgi:hypothetical protein
VFDRTNHICLAPRERGRTGTPPTLSPLTNSQGNDQCSYEDEPASYSIRHKRSENLNEWLSQRLLSVAQGKTVQDGEGSRTGRKYEGYTTPIARRSASQKEEKKLNWLTDDTQNVFLRRLDNGLRAESRLIVLDVHAYH